MYAIVADGGKQYKVTEGQLLVCELRGESPGDPVTFDKVLFYSGPESVIVGKPHVSGVSVTGTLVEEIKGPKVRSLKFRRRKDSKSLKGHRQRYSVVRIDSIAGPPAEGEA